MVSRRRTHGGGTIWIIALVAMVAACSPDPTTVDIFNLNPRGFRTTSTESLYLTMSDGARVAVEVVLPSPLTNFNHIPAIVEMTRYWRARAGDAPGERMRTAANRGYAWIGIDERGTGASFGVWSHVWSERASKDFEEVVDWVISQPWSSGRVAATGLVDVGSSAELLAARDHPAVRAVIPQSAPFDLYTEVFAPGGIYLEGFVTLWSDVTAIIDAGEWPFEEGVALKPVDADEQGVLLAQAIADHAGNGSLARDFGDITYRDEASLAGVSIEDVTPSSQQQRIGESGVAYYTWGSWMAYGSAHGALTRFVALENPQEVVIGAWTTGLDQHASPFVAPGNPPVPDFGAQWWEAINFLDRHLKDGGVPTEGRVLRYYTMGAEEWRSTTQWPVPGTVETRWYLGAENGLLPNAPESPAGEDSYAVDFAATTGPTTRWHDLLGDGIRYPDRVERDHRLVIYETPPLTESVEITGYPVVRLFLTSTHADGAVFAYLEDVDPSGGVTYVTEGQLRMLHRRVGTDRVAAALGIPYHSFKVEDGEPMTPGVVAEIVMWLQPTSVQIFEGHRLRLAIGGHDERLFARIPETGDPVITIARNRQHPSSIQLPVVR